jgi:DNA-binding CsgD family transcriptional regulator
VCGALASYAPVLEALLDLQAVVPLRTVLLTARRRAGGPDLTLLDYAARDARAAPDVDALVPTRGGRGATGSGGRARAEVSYELVHGGRVVGTFSVGLVRTEAPGAREVVALERACTVLAGVVAAVPDRGGTGLTAREVEVLRIMTTGASNREIARRLHLSHSTVKTHVERILAKLGATNRVQAVRDAALAGLV